MPGTEEFMPADPDGQPCLPAAVPALLYRYTDSLYRATSLDEIYAAALDAICAGLETDRASILRFDRQGVMRFVAWRGLSDGYRAAVDGHSPWQNGARDADVICIRDIAASGEPPELVATILGERIRALGFIPLAPENRVIGKFMIYYDHDRELTREQRELALIIARQLGFAVQNFAAMRDARHLAAIVDSSDDAIVSKSLDGIIESWNEGAARLFGFTPEEAIGQSIMMIVPEDRRDEEVELIEAIRAGKCFHSFETVRKARNGRLLDLSLTISPVMDGEGRIVGVSKIARDISERRRAAEAQALLLAEMNHRVKNAYALTSSLIQLSAASSSDTAALAEAVTQRLGALSRAHTLTVPGRPPSGKSGDRPASLQGILAAILLPFEGTTLSGQPRVEIVGDDEQIGEGLVTSIALTFHELATNAAKYGALSVGDGQVRVSVSADAGQTVIVWRERGGPAITSPASEGFGSKLLAVALRQLGEMERLWTSSGLEAIVRIPRPLE